MLLTAPTGVYSVKALRGMCLTPCQHFDVMATKGWVCSAVDTIYMTNLGEK